MGISQNRELKHDGETAVADTFAPEPNRIIYEMVHASKVTMEDVPRLINALRAHIVRKTGKPLDPDVDFLTTQIEILSASGPTFVLGEEYGLTPKESQVVSHLARRPGMIFTRGAVLNAIYSDKLDQPEPKLFDVVLCKIRKKLLKHNAPYWVETVWGHGFRYVNTPAREGKRHITGAA